MRKSDIGTRQRPPPCDRWATAAQKSRLTQRRSQLHPDRRSCSTTEIQWSAEGGSIKKKTAESAKNAENGLSARFSVLLACSAAKPTRGAPGFCPDGARRRSPPCSPIPRR